MRKFFLLCVTALLLSQAASAQSVGEPYGSGCAVEYTAGWQDGAPCLSVVVSSRALVLDEAPVLLLKTFGGRVIRSEGRKIAFWTIRGGETKEDGEFEPSTLLRTVACFPLTEDEAEALGEGVAKVRLSTFPQTYESSYRRDRIGRKLHDSFREAAGRAF